MSSVPNTDKIMKSGGLCVFEVFGTDDGTSRHEFLKGIGSLSIYENKERNFVLGQELDSVRPNRICLKVY